MKKILNFNFTCSVFFHVKIKDNWFDYFLRGTQPADESNYTVAISGRIDFDFFIMFLFER